MTPVQIVTLGRDGRKQTKVDPGGAVFVPIPGKAARPAYGYGRKDGASRSVLFTCPVSAIPDQVFELLGLWHECRLMGVLPLAGGWLDQPSGVRRAFPIFQQEQRHVDQAAKGNPQDVAALTAAMTLKAAFGRKK